MSDWVKLPGPNGHCELSLGGYMANSREGANKNLNSELNCFTNDHSLHQPQEHYDRLIITSAPYSGMELILFLRGGKHQWSLGANKQADFYLPDPRLKAPASKHPEISPAVCAAFAMFTHKISA